MTRIPYRTKFDTFLRVAQVSLAILFVVGLVAYIVMIAAGVYPFA